MVRKCAWCGVSLDGALEVLEDAPISHGICAACERTLSGSLGMPLKRFLESLSAPVILVDVELGARVTSANEEAVGLTAKTEAEMKDQLLGDVFECVNAARRGGCGGTIHCSGCAIRKAVEHTWNTGEARARVPATLRADGEDAPIALVISTERLGDQVLLRVDPSERCSTPDA